VLRNFCTWTIALALPGITAPRHAIASFLCAALLTCAGACLAAQNAAIPTAPLREIHADGLKTLPEPQVLTLSGLSVGAQTGREDMQVAADKLVQSGLFAKVRYNFQTRIDGLVVTFHVEEAERMPVYFDNLPWFADGELNESIRVKLPFYDGKLPGRGAVVDEAAEAVSELLAAHGLQAAIQHEVVANPGGDGSVQQFRIEGAPLRIARVEFSDPALNASHTIQQALADVVGKPYSRTTVDLFLVEQVKPIFQQKGFLRAKLGPPEVRLTGNPNQKLPEHIPIYIPLNPGAVYHWKAVDWSGNTVVAAEALTRALPLKPGDVADGMAIEDGWEKARDEYGRLGYLQMKIDPAPVFDDQAHTVAYTVRIEEGKPYRFGKMVLTGLSPAAEKRLRESWPIPPGELFDRAKYEQFLITLETHKEEVFRQLPLHYDEVGHWLQPDEAKGTVDVLLDFK
jgi:outer membrane protein assembly factor BamA